MTTSKRVQKRSPKPQPYWWFQGTPVAELRRQLNEYPAEDTRLEVRLDGKKMTFTVMAPDGHGPNPIDDSHVCPPQCP